MFHKAKDTYLILLLFSLFNFVNLHSIKLTVEVKGSCDEFDPEDNKKYYTKIIRIDFASPAQNIEACKNQLDNELSFVKEDNVHVIFENITKNSEDKIKELLQIITDSNMDIYIEARYMYYNNIQLRKSIQTLIDSAKRIMDNREENRLEKERRRQEKMEDYIDSQGAASFHYKLGREGFDSDGD